MLSLRLLLGFFNNEADLALVFKWAGRHRKYLVASVACATLSGLMVAVPYLAVFDVMHVVYLKTCTAELIAGDVGMLVVGVVLRFILFGLAGTLSHKGVPGPVQRPRRKEPR